MVEAQEKYSSEQSAMNAARLVFIDESGVSTALSNGYAWAPLGEKPVVIAPIRAKKLTIIGAIALDGVRATMELEGSMNGEHFLRFLDECLGPNLRPGDIVVMDRLSAHRMAGVEETLTKWGATALYLPPYSPEFNPIEICWSWIKRILRRTAPSCFSRLRDALNAAWGQVTPALCASWTRHCGYSVAST